MGKFMVERYLPGITSGQLDETSVRLAVAAEELAARGVEVRYLGSTFVPEEESCFCRFEGVSEDGVRRACEDAGVSFARILEVRDFAPVQEELGTELEPDLEGGFQPMEPRWEGILRGEHALAYAHRFGRRAFALLPGPWRCKFCNAPFRGPAAGVVRWVGYTPSRKNPSICARCIERAPEGGAVVPLTVLFADIRGFTALAEHLPPGEVPALVTRFYTLASKALLEHDGLLAQIAGDQVMALFVPGLAGAQYPSRAVAGARALLRAVGYGSQPSKWLGVGVGVGVATGEEFVGNVGGGGYKDFTAVGDVTNTAARLTATAAAGEILIDARTYEFLEPSLLDAERRDLELKGKSTQVTTYRLGAGRP